MKRSDKALRIQKQLAELYPNPPIPLDHLDTYTFLVAVMLSAQTTDKKVNEVTPALFKKAPTPALMAALPVADILQHIRPLGLAPTKAKNLKALSQQLLDLHQGIVPESFVQLEALPGVGHKTASVVMSQSFGHPAFPIDTHIHRLAERWGLSAGKNVQQTEKDLKSLFPKEIWNDLHLQIIFFGREYCPARRHTMNTCPICGWAASAQRIKAEESKNTKKTKTTKTTKTVNRIKNTKMTK
jgi:endonuclease III